MSDLDVILDRLKTLEESFEKKIDDLKESSATSPQVVTTAELCELLKITEPTVIKMRRKKQIPFLPVAGNTIRYNYPDVVKALKKSKN